MRLIQNIEPNNIYKTSFSTIIQSRHIRFLLGLWIVVTCYNITYRVHFIDIKPCHGKIS